MTKKLQKVEVKKLEEGGEGGPAQASRRSPQRKQLFKGRVSTLPALVGRILESLGEESYNNVGRIGKCATKRGKSSSNPESNG